MHSAAASVHFGQGKAPLPMARPAKGVAGCDVAFGRRVAIVEDELMVAWSLESMIGDLGYEVIALYARGEAALAGIDGDHTDIVVMDINLSGGLDGIETARRLGKAHDFHIIFISAYGDPATRARIAEDVPGATLLRKPVSASLLEKALDGALGN